MTWRPNDPAVLRASIRKRLGEHHAIRGVGPDSTGVMLDVEIVAWLLDQIDGAAWQPIDSAPLNVSVLVFLPNAEHYGPGIYRAIHVDMGTGKRWMTTGWACGRDLSPETAPTHWQPLPDPPLSLGGGRAKP